MFYFYYIYDYFINQGDDIVKYFEIDAFFPCYKEDTNIKTCIILSNGTTRYSHYNMRQFTARLLCDIGMDYLSLRLWSSKVTGAKHHLPLIIDNLNVFIPIRFKAKANGNETSYGYINMGSIERYSDTEIVLRNQVVLPTLSSTKYIEKKMVDAKLLTYAYLDNKKRFEFMWKE